MVSNSRRGYSIKNGFTLIWIMVSTSTKFALNKRTLDKKSVSTRQDQKHVKENLLPLLGTQKSEEN